MSKDVSVEFRGDEVVITKRADTAEARETVEAIRRAVELFNKNTDEMTAGAYDPPGEDDDEADKDEAELTPAERETRRQRLLIEAARSAGVPPPDSGRMVPKRLKGDTAMIDTLIEQVSKADLGFAVVKRFVEKDGDELTEHQITALLMGAWGTEFGKRFAAQTPEGLIARYAVAKAKQAAWINKAAPLTGARALATAVQPGAGKGDPLRERIIADKRTAAPWMTEAELDRYAAEMARELDRAARGKQERARPGTLERG
jgi:hypothetical protein